MRLCWLSLLLVLMSFPTAEAQYQWAPEGAKWYINDLSYPGPMYDKWQKYSTVESTGDTIVGGYKGRKVGDHIMIQDGYKVYVWWQDTVRLQYDFSLEVGDTAVFDLLHYDSTVRFQSFVVEQIDTLIVDGMLLKQFSTMGDDLVDPWACYCWPYVYAEKLGELGEIVEKSAFSIPTADHIPPFIRCYEEVDLLWKYPTFTLDCDYSNPTSIDQSLSGNITISPNPASDLLYLSWVGSGSPHTDLALRIYRSDGLLLSVCQWPAGQSDLVIPVQGFPKGLIVVQIMDDKGHLWRLEKVVVK